MKKVKFLTTSAGDYGTKFANDEAELTDSLATQLEEAGTVKVLGSAGKDPVADKSESTVNIKDETSKASTQVLSKSAAPKKSASKKGK